MVIPEACRDRRRAKGSFGWKNVRRRSQARMDRTVCTDRQLMAGMGGKLPLEVIVEDEPSHRSYIRNTAGRRRPAEATYA